MLDEQEDGIAKESKRPKKASKRTRKVKIAKGASLDANPEEVEEIEKTISTQESKAAAAGLSSVEKKVLEYARNRVGEINYSNPAYELGITVDNFRSVAKGLESKGLVVANEYTYAFIRKKERAEPSQSPSSGNPDRAEAEEEQLLTYMRAQAGHETTVGNLESMGISRARIDIYEKQGILEPAGTLRIRLTPSGKERAGAYTQM